MAASPSSESGGFNWIQAGLILGEAILALVFGLNRWLFSKVWDTLATKEHVTTELERYHQMDIAADNELIQSRLEPLIREQERMQNEQLRMHSENRAWMERLDGKIDQLLLSRRFETPRD